MDLQTLEKKCQTCQNCALGQTRKNLVFGVGNPSAEIMFIGEGPGEQEDLQGIPFVGPAGQLLDIMLRLIGLDRGNVYIANIVKCRPPKNRDPHPEEQNACNDWLKLQTDIVNPKIIVFLGRIAACYFYGQDFKITRDHGIWRDIDNRKTMAIYHPSALLRDPGKRPETFVDLKKIQQEFLKIHA